MRMRILNQTLNPINETLEYRNNVVNNEPNILNNNQPNKNEIKEIIFEDKGVVTDIPILKEGKNKTKGKQKDNLLNCNDPKRFINSDQKDEGKELLNNIFKK